MSEKSLREQLLDISLEWEARYGVMPSVTSAMSEYDAAMLVGCSEQEYSDIMQGQTAVTEGVDFEFNGIKYQIKGTRPSGKKGSTVTRVPPAIKQAIKKQWDVLIWINYDKHFNMEEAWEWSVKDYLDAFRHQEGTTAKEIRQGKRIYPQ